MKPIETLSQIGMYETFNFYGYPEQSLDVGDDVEISFDGEVYGVAKVFEIEGENSYRAVRIQEVEK